MPVMKKLLFYLLFFLSPLTLFAQSDSVIDGKWEGFIFLQGDELVISVTFNTIGGVTDGSIDIPEQSAFNLPVEVPHLTADSLVFSFETGTGPAVFRTSFDGMLPDSLSGVFEQSGVELPFSLGRAMPAENSTGDHYSEENIQIETDTHTIAGSLVTPNSDARPTLVIFVSGSGSQTRNSAVAGFEVFSELAGELAHHGYHSFRYDDRGTGQSTGELDATLPELAADLEAAGNFFRSGRFEGRFSSIVFLGHSQGGTVSLIAAEEFEPEKLILMASPLLPGDRIIMQQIETISEEQGVPEDVVEENLRFQQRIYEAARSGSGWEELEQDIEKRLREQLDALPEKQRATLGNMDQFVASQVARQLAGAKTQWFRSFIEIDPLPMLRRLEIPTLVLFGGNDTQVQEEPNREAVESISRDIAVETIPAANHLFQESGSGMPGEYGFLEKEFAGGLIPEITRFLEKEEDF